MASVDDYIAELEQAVYHYGGQKGAEWLARKRGVPFDPENQERSYLDESAQSFSAWQPIETAPKGGGAEMVTDPNWVEPPRILVLCGDGTQSVVRWDWYYAEGGRGRTDGVAWIEPCSGDQVNQHYGDPTHWMPLPEPPKA